MIIRHSFGPGSRARLGAAVVVLVFLLAAPAALAEKVPQNLASMTKELLNGAKQEIDATTGDPSQDAIRKRMQEIIRKTGAGRWAQTRVVQKDAAGTIAKALDLDVSKADLRALLQEPDRDGQIENLRALAAKQGQALDDAKFNKLLAKFDQARAMAVKDMATSQTLQVGDGGDRVEIRWDPQSGNFEVLVVGKETADSKDDGFEALVSGKVKATPTEEGDDLVLSVVADQAPVSILSSADAEKLRQSIFGKWFGKDAAVWEISRGSGEAPKSGNKPDPREEIPKLKVRIEGIKSDKVYTWKNLETGEIVQQDKFRKLRDPFEYLGQSYRLADAEAEIARLELRIQEIQAASRPVPVDQYDPISAAQGAGTDGGSQALTIEVADSNGYSWLYDSATLAGRRITARRTLRNMRDITNLPEKVVQQLIASWSPPEWIELNLKLDVRTKSVHMTGSLWRLHVTYSGDDYSVGSIHTPYARALTLARDDAASLQLTFLRKISKQFRQIDGALRFGEPFFVEATFSREQDEDVKTVNLEWGDGFRLAVPVRKRADDPKTYRSEAIVIEAGGVEP